MGFLQRRDHQEHFLKDVSPLSRKRRVLHEWLERHPSSEGRRGTGLEFELELAGDEFSTWNMLIQHEWD